MSGSPDTASVILASVDFDELADPHRVPRPDPELRQRARRTGRGSPRRGQAGPRTGRGAEGAGRSPTTNGSPPPATKSPRSAARPRRPASRLASLSAARESSLAELKTKIGQWVNEIEAAEAASRAEAEETVGRWLGGPVLDPDLHRDVRVRRQLRRRQPLQRRRRRLPDPSLDLGALRRPGRARRTRRRPNRTGSPPKSGPTPAAAPGSAPDRHLLTGLPNWAKSSQTARIS